MKAKTKRNIEALIAGINALAVWVIVFSAASEKIRFCIENQAWHPLARFALAATYAWIILFIFRNSKIVLNK